MRKNVGTTDAMIRITAGLLGLAYGVGRMSRRPYNTPWLLMSLSAMKVAEGVTRYCPMYGAMGINSAGNKCDSNVMDKIKNAGMQTVMNRVMGSSSRDEQKNENQAATTAQQSPSGSSSSSGGELNLSKEDNEMIEAVRHMVDLPSTENAVDNDAFTGEKYISDAYSHDEHRYPTYY
jgi:Protein of unknown function (DUF2892)